VSEQALIETYEEAVELLRGLISYDRSESRFDAGRLVAHFEDALGRNTTMEMVAAAGASSRQIGRYLTYGRVYRWFPDADDEGAWSQWPDALDRAEDLTFGHHEAVWASLLANEETRDVVEAERLLDLAARKGWGVTRLRRQLSGGVVDEEAEIVAVVPGEVMCRHQARKALTRVATRLLLETTSEGLDRAEQFSRRLAERVFHDHELQRALASLLRES
jgi:hypothetical protein